MPIAATCLSRGPVDHADTARSRTLSGFAALRPQWDELLSRERCEQSVSHLGMAARVVDEPARQRHPAAVAVWSDGELIAVAPLMAKRTPGLVFPPRVPRHRARRIRLPRSHRPTWPRSRGAPCDRSVRRQRAADAEAGSCPGEFAGRECRPPPGRLRLDDFNRHPTGFVRSSIWPATRGSRTWPRAAARIAPTCGGA